MENLIKRLQEEVGLTEEQALQTVAVVKDFMDKEDISVDWNKFFKGKYEEFRTKTKSFMKGVSHKVDSLSDKVFDKAEDIATHTKRTARDLSKKIYDKLNDEDL